MSVSDPSLPLAGVRVVDLTGSYAGPYCTMMLGDMGAEIIKVERPPGGDECRTWGPPFRGGESPWFLSANRNKKSVLLNVKSPAGRSALNALVESADVFVENMRPGALERSELGYEELSKNHAALIYCAITGFGMDGPLRDSPAYDLLGEGYGGIMSVSTEEGRRPLKVGTAVSDIVAGMFAAFAIVSCLHRRQRTGRGEFIDISLLDGQIAFMAPRLAAFLVGDEPQRCRGGAESPIAIYRSFKAKDGYLTLAVGNDQIWARLCKVLGMKSWMNDPRLGTNADRKQNQDVIFDALEREVQTKTRRDWIRIFSEAGVPCGPVNTCEDVVGDEQVIARKMITELEHASLGRIRLAGAPWKLGGLTETAASPPPVLGEHTEEVLRSAGLTPEAIAAVRSESEPPA
ncbi:MAG: CoA transferase [Nitrospirae bacterium]|nr:CoA transferase [Nitrospirota bacterium]